MDRDPEKGLGVVSMQPDPQAKGLDPPPPYSGVPFGGPPSAPYVLPSAPYVLPAAPYVLPAAPYVLPAAPYGLPSAPYCLPSHSTVSPQPPVDSVHLTLPSAQPLRDYVLWSLFNAMLCNFLCLGFAALTFSIKSRDRVVMGDMTAAYRYGNSARHLNIAAVCVGIITVSLLMVRFVYFVT